MAIVSRKNSFSAGQDLKYHAQEGTDNYFAQRQNSFTKIKNYQGQKSLGLLMLSVSYVSLLLDKSHTRLLSNPSSHFADESLKILWVW